MSKVVTIDGRKPPTETGADPEVIEILEQYLDKARSGDILAIGILSVHRNDHVFTVSRGRNKRHVLIACCEYLKHDLCAAEP